MNLPLISVIIPTYNRCEMLRGALESLLAEETGGEFAYEIVVVDNASTDATKAVVEQVTAGSPVPVRYFYQEIPGPAPARNCGVAEARGEWLAFFDDDELATPDWLRQLYQAALTTGAPIVGGAMHLDLPEETLVRLGHYVRHTSLREIKYYPTIHPYADKRLPGTNNALVARHVFQSVGTFDAAKICGGSDSDFFLRVKNAGLALYYTPHAIVRHRVAPNRLTQEYLRWDARQGCSAFAGLDCKFKGRLRLATLCAARIAHALLVVLPLLAWGWIRQDPGEVLGQKVRLWRTEGYVRGTLALLAPAWFPQQRYFADLEFRRGRVVGQQSMTLEAVS
jgi:succinoglycan biosynthesis protein ExoM